MSRLKVEPVEAWYYVEKGEREKHFGRSGQLSFDPPTAYGLRTMEVVHLVEADPLQARKDAVVMAAVAFLKDDDDDRVQSQDRLLRTVAALQKSQAKRSKR